MKRIFLSFSLFLLFNTTASNAETINILAIGNSFTKDATDLLPEIAAGQGDEAKATVLFAPKSSLKDHWNDLNRAPSVVPSLYESSKTLNNELQKKWDIVTIQQGSEVSNIPSSYKNPISGYGYAELLRSHILKMQEKKFPGHPVKVLMHETWAYRADNKDSDWVERKPADQNGIVPRGIDSAKMYSNIHREYVAAAEKMYNPSRPLSEVLIPVGSAFHRVSTDPNYPENQNLVYFDAPTGEPPLFPSTDPYALTIGWYRKADASGFAYDDHNHATTAGKYLAALVWYGFIFRKSPEQIGSGLDPVSANFARHLRVVATQELTNSGVIFN